MCFWKVPAAKGNIEQSPAHAIVGDYRQLKFIAFVKRVDDFILEIFFNAERPTAGGTFDAVFLLLSRRRVRSQTIPLTVSILTQLYGAVLFSVCFIWVFLNDTPVTLGRWVSMAPNPMEMASRMVDLPVPFSPISKVKRSPKCILICVLALKLSMVILSICILLPIDI